MTPTLNPTDNDNISPTWSDATSGGTPSGNEVGIDKCNEAGFFSVGLTRTSNEKIQKAKKAETGEKMRPVFSTPMWNRKQKS
jgi:hypothetical protein